jgi:ATP-binding cassette subfamily F protein uup
VNRIFAFEGNGRIRQSEGGYSDYLIRVELERSEQEEKLNGKSNGGKKAGTAGGSGENAEGGKPDSRSTWKKQEKKLKFTYKEQKEFETIDDDIAALEEQIEKLDAQIMENATNSAKLNELMIEKEDVQMKLDEKMERWIYLNDLNEQIQNAK